MCINVTHTPFNSLILIPSYLHTANTADPIYLDQSTSLVYRIHGHIMKLHTYHFYRIVIFRCHISINIDILFWRYPWYLISCVISCVYCNISNKPVALTLRNWWGLAVPASSQNDHHFVSGSRSNVSQNLAIIIYHITCSSWRTSGRTP